MRGYGRLAKSNKSMQHRNQGRLGMTLSACKVLSVYPHGSLSYFRDASYMRGL